MKNRIPYLFWIWAGALLIARFTLASTHCEIVLSNTSGDFYKKEFKRIEQSPVQASPKNFKFSDGYYCNHRSNSLEGRFTFQDPSSSKWEVQFTTVPMGRNRTRLSVLEMRDGKKYGNQLDVEFNQTGCSLVDLPNPISLIGLETKDGKLFSASLVCSN